jgi:hypothetical protein
MKPSRGASTAFDDFVFNGGRETRNSARNADLIDQGLLGCDEFGMVVDVSKSVA